MVASRKDASVLPPFHVKPNNLNESSSESYASIASSDESDNDEDGDDKNDEDDKDDEDGNGNAEEEDDKMKKEETSKEETSLSSTTTVSSSINVMKKDKTKSMKTDVSQDGEKDNDMDVDETPVNKNDILQKEDMSEEAILREYTTMSNSVRNGLLSLAGISEKGDSSHVKTKSVDKTNGRRHSKNGNISENINKAKTSSDTTTTNSRSKSSEKPAKSDQSSDGKQAPCGRSPTGTKRRHHEDDSSSSPRKKIKKDYKTMDVMLLRKNADDLMKKARGMKHAGDKAAKEDSHVRGLYYLQSALHFFEYALILDDIKHTYRLQKDASRCKKYGHQALQMLPQTASLIDVAARNFNSDLKWIAICNKFAAFVHMYIFKIQRVKLSAIHTELQQASVTAKVLGSAGSVQLPTPVSSPCLSTGSSPLVPSSASANVVGSLSNDYFIKESGNMFKAFELWSRYERFDRTVLPQLTDFATADMEQVVTCVQSVLKANLPTQG